MEIAMKGAVLVVALLTVVVTFVTAQTPEQATLHDSRGTVVGTATLKASGTPGATIELSLKGLPPGEHAVHLHETPKCEAPSFQSAGPHLNPTGMEHGLKNPKGPHAGDMNNVVVAENGTATITFVNSRVVMSHDKDSLRSGGGAAIVIHAQPDDMKSDPDGNAGNRIACGVISAR
jgi:superoxide dismutase, Cu-Zn family